MGHKSGRYKEGDEYHFNQADDDYTMESTPTRHIRRDGVTTLDTRSMREGRTFAFFERLDLFEGLERLLGSKWEGPGLVHGYERVSVALPGLDIQRSDGFPMRIIRNINHSRMVYPDIVIDTPVEGLAVVELKPELHRFVRLGDDEPTERDELIIHRRKYQKAIEFQIRCRLIANVTGLNVYGMVGDMMPIAKRDGSIWDIPTFHSLLVRYEPGRQDDPTNPAFLLPDSYNYVPIVCPYCESVQFSIYHQYENYYDQTCAAIGCKPKPSELPLTHASFSKHAKYWAAKSFMANKSNFIELKDEPPMMVREDMVNINGIGFMVAGR